jgi:cellulose synthase (UDP-forming)
MTGVIPGRMSFADFIIQGTFIIIIATSIYAYGQNFMCDTRTERKFHWRGMILKFACWPVYFSGFFLTIRNKEIPYLPTAKKAAIGFITPYIKPLVIYNLLFVLLVIAVYINRRYFVPESEIMFSSQKVWGMVGFAFIAVLQSIIAIFAAYEAKWIKDEEPWKHIDVSKINTYNK